MCKYTTEMVVHLIDNVVFTLALNGQMGTEAPGIQSYSGIIATYDLSSITFFQSRLLVVHGVIMLEIIRDKYVRPMHKERMWRERLFPKLCLPVSGRER